MSLIPFPADAFRKVDESDDSLFYAYPRKVVHIDDAAIAALADVFVDVLPRGGEYLDLMSSWRSHLPDGHLYDGMVGLGMNAEEMADNPQLDDYVVHNLNENPTLPYADNRFRAVLCTVSVQYLTDPVAGFKEVNRVLKPGGAFVVSFSNRCFPQKAVALWQLTTDHQHMAIVATYFEASGGWMNIEAHDRTPQNVTGQTDPLYVVWGYKA